MLANGLLSAAVLLMAQTLTPILVLGAARPLDRHLCEAWSSTDPPPPLASLIIAGHLYPGGLLNFYLIGGLDASVAYLAYSPQSGSTWFDFGSFGGFQMDLNQPLKMIRMPNPDASGASLLSLAIPATAPGSFINNLTVFFQVATLRLTSTFPVVIEQRRSNMVTFAGGPALEYAAPGDPWTLLKQAAVSQLNVAPGWGVATLLPGAVNSTGWEDSASISGDGQTLSFSYIPCDFQGWIDQTGGDLNSFVSFQKGPVRSLNPPFSIDTFQAAIVGGVSQQPVVATVSTNTTPLHQAETGMMVAASSSFYATNAPATLADHDTNIYQDGLLLSFCGPHDENDPSYRAGELFFWSDNRPGGLGGKDIWMTSQSGTAWTAPALAAPPVNQALSDSWQPYLSPSGKLYFTSNRESYQAIYVSDRQGNNLWGTPSKVVWPGAGGTVVAVGEPTLTDDGQTLYFVVLFQDAAGAFDLDVAVIQRLTGE